jgi:hypothetical protein
MSMMHIRLTKENETNETVDYKIESPDFNLERNWTAIGLLHLDKAHKRYEFVGDDRWECNGTDEAQAKETQTRLAKSATEQTAQAPWLWLIQNYAEIFLDKNYFPAQHPNTHFR